MDIFQATGRTPGVKASTSPEQNIASSGIAMPQADVAKAASEIYRQSVKPQTISLSNPQTSEEQEVAGIVNRSLEDTETIASSFMTQERIDELKNSPMGFWDGLHLEIPGYSVGKEIGQLQNIRAIRDKFEAGETLTAQEQDRLGSFVKSYLEDSLRPKSIGYGIAYGVSELPSFMASFGLANALGGAIKGASWVAGKGAASSMARRVAVNTAAYGVAGSVVFTPQHILGYNERRLHDGMSITDKGDAILRQSTEKPATSALLAASYNMAEYASEFAGGPIGYVGGRIAGAVVPSAVREAIKTPLHYGINKLPPALTDALYSAYKAIQPNATISKVMTAAGWNGMLAELGEERVGDIMRGFIALSGNDTQATKDGQDYTAKDFFNAITPSADQLLVEAGVIGVAGGVSHATSAALNLMQQRGIPLEEAKTVVENMSALEKEELVTELAPKLEPAAIIPTEAEIPDVVKMAGQELLGSDIAITPTGTKINVDYAIVDANSLITSNTDDLSVNPNYPQELQPRDRSRAATELQIRSIINPERFRPELLGKSADATGGAPIVGTDMVVQSGNARSIAIRRAYMENGATAKAYRDYLAQQGFDLTDIENPVLVRINRSNMTQEQLQSFTRDANTSTVLSMSATEKAMADARSLPDDVLDLATNGDLTSAANRDFVRRSLQSIATQNDLGQLVGADGFLTQEGLRRVQGAMLAKAYDSPAIVLNILESTDSNIKAIGNALLDAAPAWNRLRSSVRAGAVPQEFDITDYLKEAVSAIDRARTEGKPITDYVNQTDIFNGDSISPEAEKLLRFFLAGDNLNRRIGQEKIATALIYYAQEANKVQSGPSLFGEGTQTKPSEIVEAASAKAKGAKEAGQAGLFQSSVDKQTGSRPVSASSASVGSTEQQTLKDEAAGLSRAGEYKDVTKAAEMLHASGSISTAEYEKAVVSDADPTAEANKKTLKKIASGLDPVHDKLSFIHRWLTNWTNELEPVRLMGELVKKRGLNVPGTFKTKKFSPIELATRMYSALKTEVDYTLNVAVFHYDSEGNAVTDHKGLLPILKDFENYFINLEPNSQVRFKEINDFLISSRYLNDLEDMENVKVTDKQLAESNATMEALKSKYGEHFVYFGTIAKEVYDFQKSVLYKLVREGNMSQSDYDDIISKHQHYIPLRRVLDKDTSVMDGIRQNPIFNNPVAMAVIEKIHGMVGSKHTFFGLGKKSIFDNPATKMVVKAIRGSEREVENPMESIVMNTMRIMDLAARNRVGVMLYNYRNVVPDMVQVVEKAMVKRGTVEVKVTYDKKLREKLTQLIDMFGHTFEQKNTLNKKGQRGLIRGDYSPMEKKVRLRLGASDATLTHEAGHMLDFELGIGQRMLADEDIKAQLIKLADERLQTETLISQNDNGETAFEDKDTGKESAKFIEYIHNDREIIANFFDGYVNAPELTKKVAPKAVREFERIIKERPELSFILDIKPSLERAEEVVTKDAYVESTYKPPNSLTVFVDGQKTLLQVSAPIIETFASLAPEQLNILEKLFMGMTNVFRTGVTITPEFMMTSLVRETHSAFIQNRDVKYNLKDTAKGLISVIVGSTSKGNDLYERFSKSARFGTYFEPTFEGIQKSHAYIVKGAENYSKNPLHYLEKLGVKVDEVNRVGVFNAAKKQGFSDMEAALVARDVFDYSQRGKIAKKINRYVPFFCAGLRGSYRLAQAVQQRPKETAFWGLATVSTVSLLGSVYYLSMASDEDREWYLNVPDEIKRLRWVMKSPSGEVITIPKPFQFGYLFGGLVEEFMSFLYKEDKDTFAEVAKKVTSGLAYSLLPFSDDSSVIPMIPKLYSELSSNYNFFTNKPIYPDFLERLDPSQRYTASASETAKAAGEFFNISPAYVDHVGRSLIGGSWWYATGASDSGIRAWKNLVMGEDVPERPMTISDLMLIRAFVKRPPEGFRSNSYRVFNERMRDISQRYNTSKTLEGDEKDDYVNAHSVELALHDMMQGVKKQIGEANDGIEAIYKDEAMTSDEKVQAILELEKQITNLAQEANREYSSRMRENRGLQ